MSSTIHYQFLLEANLLSFAQLYKVLFVYSICMQQIRNWTKVFSLKSWKLKIDFDQKLPMHLEKICFNFLFLKNSKQSLSLRRLNLDWTSRKKIRAKIREGRILPSWQFFLIFFFWKTQLVEYWHNIWQNIDIILRNIVWLIIFISDIFLLENSAGGILAEYLTEYWHNIAECCLADHFHHFHFCYFSFVKLSCRIFTEYLAEYWHDIVKYCVTDHFHHFHFHYFFHL